MLPTFGVDRADVRYSRYCRTRRWFVQPRANRRGLYGVDVEALSSPHRPDSPSAKTLPTPAVGDKLGNWYIAAKTLLGSRRPTLAGILRILAVS
jgi:hypothetical protein